MSPLLRVVAASVDAGYLWLRGSADEAIDAVMRGRDIRDRYHIGLMGSLLFCQESYALATGGRIVEASLALARVRDCEVDAARMLDISHVAYQDALIQLQAGALERALQAVQTARATAAHSGGPHQWALGAIAQARILHAARDTDAARRCLAEAERHLDGSSWQVVQFPVLVSRALFDLDEGLDCLPALREAFAIGARNDILNLVDFWPKMMSRLAALAIEHGIELAYTHRLIEKRSLPPPYPIESWPLPVKVYAASGEIRVVVRGHSIDAQRTVLPAPLRLLQTVVALASKAGPNPADAAALQRWMADRDDIARALRPHADAEANDAWIDQNLKRLRKLLDCPDAIEASGRMLAINPERVWVDVLDPRACSAARRP